MQIIGTAIVYHRQKAEFRRARLVSDLAWPSPNKLILCSREPHRKRHRQRPPCRRATVPGLPCLPRFVVLPIWGRTLRRPAGRTTSAPEDRSYFFLGASRRGTRRSDCQWPHDLAKVVGLQSASPFVTIQPCCHYIRIHGHQRRRRVCMGFASPSVPVGRGCMD